MAAQAVCKIFVWHDRRLTAETKSIMTVVRLPAAYPQFLARLPQHTPTNVFETLLLRAAGSDW